MTRKAKECELWSGRVNKEECIKMVWSCKQNVRGKKDKESVSE